MLLTKQDSQPSLYRQDKEVKLLLDFYKKRRYIPMGEPGFWQVYRGVVQLSKITNEGNEIILGWITANNYFGNFISNKNNYQAQSLSDTYVRWYSFLDIAKSPELTRILITQLSQRLIRTQQLLTIIRLTKIEERLWQVLLILKEEMGQSVTNGTRLTIHFTHKNLAYIVGTTRVTVTKILGKFQQKGLIYLDRQHHIIFLEINS